MSVAWHNNQFVDKNALSVSIVDYGFSRGMTVFELTRVYGSTPFRLEDHIDRFLTGARIFGIAPPLAKAELIKTVHEMTSKNKLSNSVVKFYLTAGECAHAGGGFANSSGFTPHLYILEEEVKPLHPDAPRGLDVCERGLQLKTVPFRRQTPEVKSINYAPGFCAAQEWGKQGYDEILFLEEGHLITETTTANFFAVVEGTLCTPHEHMLSGVTRKVMLELAKTIDIPASIRALKIDEMAEASEAFITGSFVEMVPVKKIDGYEIPQTTKGPIYSQLRKAMTTHIKDQCFKAL